MKKIYLLGLFTAVASVSFAQWSVQQSPSRRTFTRSEISPRASVRQEMAPSIDWSNRVVLLTEDFQGVSGTMPGALPTGWSTVQVVQADLSNGNAFKTHTSTTANGGGYWPVPLLGTGNKFAGANDDNVPCDCDMVDAYVQSPSMDFSTASNIAISFDIFHDTSFNNILKYFKISFSCSYFEMDIKNRTRMSVPVKIGILTSWSCIFEEFFQIS